MVKLSFDGPDVVFLVYDSRSGSTLLSKKIMQWLRNTIVTPEIEFIPILRMKNSVLLTEGWEGVAKSLDGYAFRNIKDEIGRIDDVDLRGNIQERKFSIIIAILELFITNEARLENVQHIIVKSGEHIKYWRVLCRVFGKKVKFLHIIRDPRAVINSKMKTRRAYFPFENMAWGGTMLAAYRWLRYCREMRKAMDNGVSVLNIKYEDLMHDEALVMERIAKFLGTRVMEKKEDQSYIVPGRESEMHPLVNSGKNHIERIDAWRSELTARDVKVIEAVLERDMDWMGYRPECTRSFFKKTVIITIEIPRMIWLIVLHYYLNYKFRNSKFD